MSDQTHEDAAIKQTGAGKTAPSKIVIDGAYFRGQARDAMLTFIAPLQGVYMAATGTGPRSAVNGSKEQKKDA